MAGSVNKVILVGNLGKDPEIRHMPDGAKVANFSVATSDVWKDKMTGERRDRTEWHRVSVMNERIADVVEKYLRKGSKVYVEGQLQTRKWTDQQGAERYTTEVLISRFRGELTLLDNKQNGAMGADDGFSMDDTSFGRSDTGNGFGSSAAPSHGIDLADDVPF